MTPDHLRLILNGKSADDDSLRQAVRALRDRGAVVEVRVTWKPGDAARLVAAAIDDGATTLVAAGGDGTLSEIAAALAARDEAAAGLPALALVPLGTANDFATAAGIPTEPLAALELALAEPARPIDLLRVEAGDAVHWCANLASGGFGTSITVETNEGLKKMLGGLAYLITGIARMGRIEPLQARISGPGFAWEGGFIALGIGNGRQAGGGQALCPDALVDDGLLDLTVVPELEGEVAATLGRVVSEGRAAALDQVAVRARLPWLEIEAGESIVLNLDGEPVEAQRFRLECVAARVRMHLPSASPLLAGGAVSAAAQSEGRDASA
ncbi:lipid kinase YegS [Luteimonas sp. SJ-92]|uniref:Probable lipid kinase YegS-like n=1 Tax=Luteimonas salinisoli TaxID=2752307 RepID=A0A853J8B2_9GAMM|nr:lipid kinase YegS [Luteimonas salinisoli]NZA25353.1 lipid kinase YegS [Luteimonas salinisoli]